MTYLDAWPQIEEMRWASGLFEGEGSIGTKDLIISVGMTDKDSVDRFHAAIRFGSRGAAEKAPPRKRLYLWYTQNFEMVQAAAAMLWWGLGERRRAQFMRLLRLHRGAPVVSWKKTCCPNGHLYNRTVTRRSGSKIGHTGRYCSHCSNARRRKYG